MPSQKKETTGSVFYVDPDFSDGRVKIEGVFSVEGILSYPDGKGGVVRHFRPKAVNKDPKTLELFKSAWVVTNHPPEKLVDVFTAKEKGIGFVESVYANELGDIVGTVVVDTLEGIRALKKYRQFSVCYVPSLVFDPGVYKGQPYEYVQVGIRMVNHIALCEEGNAGFRARITKILTDSKVQVFLDSLPIKEQKIMADYSSMMTPQQPEYQRVQFEGTDHNVPKDLYPLIYSLLAYLKRQEGAVQGISDEIKNIKQESKDEDKKKEEMAAMAASDSLKWRLDQLEKDVKQKEEKKEEEQQVAAVADAGEGGLVEPNYAAQLINCIDNCLNNSNIDPTSALKAIQKSLSLKNRGPMYLEVWEESAASSAAAPTATPVDRLDAAIADSRRYSGYSRHNNGGYRAGR